MNKIRILVVDDERIIADTLALILRQNGYDVTTAYSGEQALASADGSGPDFVISDINLGRMNGIDAAIAITRNCPGCHVLLFSGHPATSDLLIKARADGHAFEALSKPVPPEKLLNWLTSKGLKEQAVGSRE